MTISDVYFSGTKTQAWKYMNCYLLLKKLKWVSSFYNLFLHLILVLKANLCTFPPPLVFLFLKANFQRQSVIIHVTLNTESYYLRSLVDPGNLYKQAS